MKTIKLLFSLLMMASLAVSCQQKEESSLSSGGSSAQEVTLELEGAGS